MPKECLFVLDFTYFPQKHSKQMFGSILRKGYIKRYLAVNNVSIEAPIPVISLKNNGRQLFCSFKKYFRRKVKPSQFSSFHLLRNFKIRNYQEICLCTNHSTYSGINQIKSKVK